MKVVSGCPTWFGRTPGLRTGLDGFAEIAPLVNYRSKRDAEGEIAGEEEEKGKEEVVKALFD